MAHMLALSLLQNLIVALFIFLCVGLILIILHNFLTVMIVAERISHSSIFTLLPRFKAPRPVIF